MELEHTEAWTPRLFPLVQHTYYLPTEYNLFNRLLDGWGRDDCGSSGWSKHPTSPFLKASWILSLPKVNTVNFVMPRARQTQLYKVLQPIPHWGAEVSCDGHNASPLDLWLLLSGPLLMGYSHPPLPDSFRDSSQAIISEYFHHSSSLALEFQLVSIQKKIAPFILSFMDLFTFIYCSAAFLIRYLKISPSPLTSDPVPFLTVLSFSWADSISFYIFSGFQLIPLFFSSYQMR